MSKCVTFLDLKHIIKYIIGIEGKKDICKIHCPYLINHNILIYSIRNDLLMSARLGTYQFIFIPRKFLRSKQFLYIITRVFGNFKMFISQNSWLRLFFYLSIKPQSNRANTFAKHQKILLREKKSKRSIA